MNGMNALAVRDRLTGLGGRRSLFVIALLIAASIGAGIAVGPAGAADVAVVSVHSTPDRPTVYDDVSVGATVTAPAAADQRYVIDTIAIREGEGSNSDLLEDEDTNVTVYPGRQGSVSAEIDIDTSGSRTVYAHLRILTGGSGVVSVVRPVTIDVIDPHPSLSLRSTPIDGANRTSLSLNVVNGRQTDLRGLSLDTTSTGVRIQEPRRVAGDLAGGETARFEFTGVEATPGPATVNVSMKYVTADGEQRSTSQTLRADLERRRNPPEIALTNTRISREDGQLVVRGEASNVGGGNISGLQVGIGTSDQVGPAQNRATYFAGSVDADEYKTFTVHARLDNASESVTVPVEIEYTVDGIDQSRTFDLAYDPGPAPDRSGGQSIDSTLAIGGVLVVLVVAIGGLYGVYRFRTRDDGDA